MYTPVHPTSKKDDLPVDGREEAERQEVPAQHGRPSAGAVGTRLRLSSVDTSSGMLHSRVESGTTWTTWTAIKS